MANEKSITEKTAVVNIGSPKAMATFAKELKQFVVGNKLYTGISDKNYVHVEGWQFAGASMGIFPVVEKLENISPEDKVISYKTKFGSKTAPVYKYRAEVKLIRIATGDVVGYGVAICSNEEAKKNSFDEYAVASMAQTRATGKAFRMSIGWVMKLAGYEATPAEEASNDVSDDVIEETPPVELPIADIRILVDMALQKMSAPEKVKFLKDTVRILDTNKLTDQQYRNLYEQLPREN